MLRGPQLDAVRVSADPTFRLIGSKRNWDRGAAFDLDVCMRFVDGDAGESLENLPGADGMLTHPELVAQSRSRPTVQTAWCSTWTPRQSARPVANSRRQCLQTAILSPRLLSTQSCCCSTSRRCDQPRREAASRQRARAPSDWDELLLRRRLDTTTGGGQTAPHGSAPTPPSPSPRSTRQMEEPPASDYVIRIRGSNEEFWSWRSRDILFRATGYRLDSPSRPTLPCYKSFRPSLRP